MIFIKVLKNTIQIKSAKYWLFFYMIVDNKTLNPIITKLSIKGRKLNISKKYYALLYYENSKQELRQIASTHSSNFRGFMNLYKKCTTKPYSF